MPIEEKSTTKHKTVEVTTKRFICAEDGCEAAVENWDPRNDPDVGNPRCDVGHDLNYVSLNPAVTQSAMPHQDGPNFSDEVGVYVCHEHISKVGELLAEKLT